MGRRKQGNALPNKYHGFFGFPEASLSFLQGWISEVFMARSAVITGWAHSPFGKLEDADTEALMARVVRPALDHAGIEPQKVDGIFVGVMNNGFQKQDFQGTMPALGEPALAHKPATRLENACATGSAAIYAALN